MQQIVDVLGKAFNAQVYKCVVSNPRDKSAEYQKIEIVRMADGKYQIAQYTKTQVFHMQKSADEMIAYLSGLLQTHFRQYNAWDAEKEYSIRITDKGKVLFSAHKNPSAPPVAAAHNRTKNYILPEGQPIAPLVDMGIFTKQGKVAAPMYSKYRQINRFLELVDDAVKTYKSTKPLRIVDFGCGKSYLTFVLYYYFTQIRQMDVRITGLDLRADVIEKCQKTAEQYGYEHLNFEIGNIDGFVPDEPVDMVITLHACDTATDYALYNAITWNVQMIFSVPCCQHELNAQIKSETFGTLTRHGLIRERTAALMTDGIRADLLEYCGYKTQVLEFIDMEHTPKNILIRAVKRKGATPNREKYLQQTQSVLDAFGVHQTLHTLLKQSKHIP